MVVLFEGVVSLLKQVWALSSVRWWRDVAGGRVEIVLSEWGGEALEEEDVISLREGMILCGGPIPSEESTSYGLIYDGREAPLAIASVQLQEQRDYVLEVLWEGEGEAPQFACFPQFSSAVFHAHRTRRKGVIAGGKLNFRDYVGGAWFEVDWGGRAMWRESVEVRSKKLDYLQEYVVLMEDLAAQATALLFQVKSPVYAVFQQARAGRARAGLEHFLLLRHVLLDPSMDAAFWEIAQSPIQALRQEQRWRPTAQVSSIDPRSWLRGLHKGGVYRSFPENAATGANDRCLEPRRKLGHHGTSERHDILPTQVVPARLPVWAKTWTSDTSENRFVLWLLDSLSRILEEMRQVFRRAGEVGYVGELERLGRLCEVWRTRLPFAGEVPSEWPRVFPFAHLRGRAGYREVLACSERMSSILQLSWEEGAQAIAGPLRDMAKLYEYWAFFEIWRALNKIATPMGRVFPPTVEESQGLVLRLKRGADSALHFVSGDLVLVLYYQLRFEVGGGILQSYSVPMTPDFSIVLRRKEQVLGVLCFDAKYRPEGSLEKMHAYRDALRGALGVYLLYPGDPQEPVIFTQDPNRPLLGVGAFPLRPQPSARQWLPAFLSVILEQV